MKIFLASVAAYAVLIAVTGVVYTAVSTSATDAYALESARVGHESPVDGRLGWRGDER